VVPVDHPEPAAQPVGLNLPAGRRIWVSGRVQGVGFRPFVWRLAQQHRLTGHVFNDAAGVVIEAWGDEERLDHFIQALPAQAPAPAEITALQVELLAGNPTPAAEFTILPSRGGAMSTHLVADLATCPDCQREIFDSNDRRYHYPFTNCSHCGPRFSILRHAPYDRINTTMAAFAMCDACTAEYQDSANRRFHAQPTACPACGPQLWLEGATGQRIAGDAIHRVAALLGQGKIIAIKGLGGFHLACDARNARAVEQLRQRKHRPDKPFALMATDLAMIGRYAHLTPKAAELLQSSAAPIVLLTRAGEPLAEALAPGQNRLGLVLPYTPLHHVLMAELDHPIVLTSGNPNGEPHVIDNQAARDKLGDIADYLLLHDREIIHRLDDSVASVEDETPQVIRRARGYAPQPIKLPAGFANTPQILAMGSELKSTFCLIKNGEAILSPHLGDLESAAHYREYRATLERYLKLFDFAPQAIALDSHPGYHASQLGRQLAEQWSIPLIEVQHHHAHITAVMAEHQLPFDNKPGLGIALDGLGLGSDGQLWGGEFLLADYRDFKRLAHFQPVPLPGGALAMQQPWRNAVAQLHQTFGWPQICAQYPELEWLRAINQRQPVGQLLTMMERGINAPLASSCGRLFDAVAAVLNLHRDRISFEGQAAIALQQLAEQGMAEVVGGYPVSMIKQNGVTQLVWQPMWQALLNDLKANKPAAHIAARFHLGLADAFAECASKLCAQHTIDTVVLGGGVMQNHLLRQLLEQRLGQSGLQVLGSQTIPANDGGVALGQGVVGAQMMSTEQVG